MKGIERMLAQIGLRLTLSSAGTLRGTESVAIKTRLSSYDAGVAELLRAAGVTPQLTAEPKMVRTAHFVGRSWNSVQSEPRPQGSRNRLATHCKNHRTVHPDNGAWHPAQAVQ